MAARKKPKVTQEIPTPPAPIPIWKKPWVWFSSFVIAVAAVLASVSSILSDVRTIPGEARKTSDQFFEWYGEYEAWKGHWSSNPEGLVDAAELNLSNEAFRLNINETKGGSIAGWIETQGICDKVPVFEELLFDGSISSARRARIEIFDFVGGHRRPFASLALRRDGNVMTVVPEDDPAEIFAKETRIALDPDDLKASESLEPICLGKRAKFFTDVINKSQQRQSASK